MTTEAEIIQKAGAGKSATFDTTMMTAANLRAESTINCMARYNFSDTFATLNIDVKQAKLKSNARNKKIKTK